MPLPRSKIEILDKAIGAKLAGVYTTLPGIVVKYDAPTNLADVRLAVKVSLWSDDGERVYEEIEVLPEVPVQWPRFNGYMVAGVLAVGDTVAVHFCSDAIGEWRVSGEVSEPVDARRLSVGYPFCSPGLAPDIDPPGDVAARQAGLVIGREGQETQIRISATEIKLGATAADFVALASKVDAELAKIAAALTAVANGGGALTGANTYTVPLATGAAITKAK